MVRVACGRSSTPVAGPNCPPVAFALRRLCDPGLNTAAIADGIGMSDRGVQKAFLREVGQTPMAFIVDHRLARAAEMLARADGRSVTEIAFDVGFNDSASFSRCFRRRYDVMPSRWAAQPMTWIMAPTKFEKFASSQISGSRSDKTEARRPV
jgi:AraC-like DNA-binding protein